MEVGPIRFNLHNPIWFYDQSRALFGGEHPRHHHSLPIRLKPHEHVIAEQVNIPAALCDHCLSSHHLFAFQFNPAFTIKSVHRYENRHLL